MAENYDYKIPIIIEFWLNNVEGKRQPKEETGENKKRHRNGEKVISMQKTDLDKKLADIAQRKTKQIDNSWQTIKNDFFLLEFNSKF